jgi:hypothetical protein
MILKKLLFDGGKKGEGGFLSKINNMRKPRAAKTRVYEPETNGF